MKKLIVVILIAVTGCQKYPESGQVVWSIEVIGESTCTYYTYGTKTGGFGHAGIIGPCNLYKVGDTLKLK